jgi:hypothetical protein
MLIMLTKHLEILVEEQSMEAFLLKLLPRMLAAQTFNIHAFQGKKDLLKNLEARLRSYAKWLPEDCRIIVIIDRDNDNCLELKKKMENAAQKAGLQSRTQSKCSTWRIVNRIVIEELESWYFGDWEAVKAAYPNVSASISKRAKFREPDKISGGTWESFEKVMQEYDYFKSGLAKIQAARAIGERIDPNRNCSPSFNMLKQVILEASDIHE